MQYFLLTVVPAHATPLARVTAPAITNVTGPSSGTYKKGDVLSFTIKFNMPVKVTGTGGTIYVQLYLGAPNKARQAVWVSNTTSDTQVFSYTLTDGDDYTGTVTWDNFISITSGGIFDPTTTDNSIDPAATGKATFQSGAATSTSGITIDATSPKVSGLIQVVGTGNVVSGSDLQFLVTFSEQVKNITTAGWAPAGANIITPGSLDVVVTGPTTCTVTYHNVVNGDYQNSRLFQLQLIAATSGITDMAGNPIVANGYSEAYNVGPGKPPAPTTTITVDNNKTKVNGDFNITVTFSNTLASFDPTKLSCGSCTATFTGTTPGGPYTYKISPTGNTGTATISLPAGAGQDAFGQASLASNTVTVDFDKVQPTVSITPSQDAATGTFNAVLVFSKPVTTPDVSKLTGTNGTVTVTEISPNDRTTYKVVFTPAAQETDINFGVAQGASKDDYGNDNVANSVLYHFDLVNPTVLSIVPTSASPTNGNAASFQVTFSEKVTIPVATDFVISGTQTVSAAISGITAVGGSIPATSYIVSLSNVVGDGILNLQIIAGTTTIQDVKGNPLSGGGTSSSGITVDHTAPTVTLAGTTLFGQNPYNVQLHFSEAVVLGVQNISATNGTTVLGVTQVDAQNWTVQLSSPNNGNITLTIGANSWKDLAGNPLASTPFTISFDNTVPQPTLTKQAGYDAPFKVDLQFSTDITASLLDVSMFDVTNGSITMFSGSGRNWVLTIQPQAPGTVSIAMKASQVQSLAGIQNAASNLVTWTYDPAPFDVTLSTTAPDPAINTFDVNVVLTKTAASISAGMFTVLNGTISSITKVDDTHYTVTVNVTANGNVTVTFNANQLQDAVGRPNNKSNDLTVNSVINHAPTGITLSNNSVDENQPVGTVVGTLSATDQDAGNTFTYTLMPSSETGFTISGNQLVTAASFDYETKNSYNIRIKVEDTYGATYEQDFVININNVNEAPSDITLSNNTIPEDKPAGTAIGSFSATDPENNIPLTYSLVAGTGGTDNAAFTIVNGVLQSAAIFEYNTKNIYNIRVRVTDALGASFEKTFTINVTAVNHTPTDIQLSNTTLFDHSPVGTKVGYITTTDKDANEVFQYALLTSADQSKFTIGTDANGTYLALTTQAEYMQQNSFSIIIEVTDHGGAVFSKPFTINVLQGNYPPTDIQLDNTVINENATVGSLVGNLSGTDPNPGDHLTYSLVSTGDDIHFDISGSTLVTKTTFDYSVKSVYHITIRATDDGGESFDKQFVITIKNTNHPPTDITLSSTSVPENNLVGTQVGALSATSIDPVTYSFGGGADDGSFTISGTNLIANASFDYETKNAYQIKITATTAGGLTFTKDFTINVTNVNEAPTDIALSNNTVVEQQIAGTTIGTLSTIDPDAGDVFTYTIVGGTDAAKFQVVGNQLKNAVVLNYATQSVYTVRIRTTDGGGLYFEKDFTINVTEKNLAPTDIQLSKTNIDEGLPVNTIIGTITGTDPNVNDQLSYSLVLTGDYNSFVVTGDKLYATSSFDYGVKSSYSITLRVMDNGGLYMDKQFTITVNNKTHGPSDIQLSKNSIAENSAIGSLVGNLTATSIDAANTLVYSFAGGADDASFTINGTAMNTNTALDFETKNIYNIKIKVTDTSGLSYTKDFVINVTDVNEEPTDVALSNNTIPEKLPVAAAVGTLSTSDPDAGDQFIYTITGGADAAKFQLSGNVLQTAAVLSFQQQQTYVVRIRSTDAGGLFVEKDFTIHITAVNSAPTDIQLSNNTIAEKLPVSAAVGTLSATDPDAGDTFTYSIVGGADATKFKITGDVLQTNAVLDFQQQQSYVVRIRVTDSGNLIFEKDFTIYITDTNVAPTDIQLSNTVVEDQTAANTNVGKLTATDADANEAFTYTLSGTDAAKFNVVLAGGEYYLQTAAAVNMQQQSSYSITITVTDHGGKTFSKAFTITVKEKNVAPTDIQLHGTTVNEGLPAGTTVGTITGTDPNTNDQLTFSLPAVGDNSNFTINGTTLVTNAQFDFATKSQYTITIRATDLGGLTFDKQFTITVNNTGHPPTDIALSNMSVPENSAVGTLVGNLSATSVDPVNSLTYSFGGGTDDAQFTISGTTLKTNAVFDYEKKNVYNIKIKVTGGSGLSYTKDFTINVTDVNDAPTDIALDNNTILENSPAGTAIGSFTATDQDAGEAFTWSFGGGADDSKFVLVGNKLQSNAVFDYETKNSYSIRIRVTDKGGLYFEKDFTINVLDVNEPPTITNPGNQVVCDGQQAQEITLKGLSAGPEKNQTISIVATSSKDFFDVLTTRDNGDGTGALRFQLKKGISGVTTITVLVRDNGGTANGGQDQVAITFDLTVNELPVVTITSDKGVTVPLGTIVNITATGGNQYAWGDAPGVISGKNTPVLTVQPTATNTYLVTVTNVYGCTVTTDFKLEVNGKVGVEASNILTPNGDGINDRWVVKNIAQYPNNEVRIYDRAGRLIYNRKGYANEWDGRLNGNVLAEGTYYYLLDLGDGKVVKGFITIVHQ